MNPFLLAFSLAGAWLGATAEAPQPAVPKVETVNGVLVLDEEKACWKIASTYAMSTPKLEGGDEVFKKLAGKKVVARGIMGRVCEPHMTKVWHSPGCGLPIFHADSVEQDAGDGVPDSDAATGELSRLIEQAASGDEAERGPAAEELRRKGASALAAIETAIEEAGRLSKYADDAAKENLRVRKERLEPLLKEIRESAVKRIRTLAENLESKDEGLRRKAVEELMGLAEKNPAVKTVLEERLDAAKKDGKTEVQERIEKVLERIEKKDWAGEEDDIQALIAALGGAAFAEREIATARLVEIGAPAMPALKEAAKNAADVEVQMRARRILEEIDKAEHTRRQKEKSGR